MGKTWLRALAAATLAGAFCVSGGPARADGDQDLSEQIRAVLKAHPEIIIEALQQRPIQVFEIASQGGAMKRDQLWRAEIERSMQKPLTPAIGGPRAILGRADAPVTVFEYTDFSCQSCARNAEMILGLLEDNPERVRIFLKHFPSDEYSRVAALYFEAIARQSAVKAWQFQNLAFKRQEQMRKKGLGSLPELAEELGVDDKALARDLADPALAGRIDADEAEARAFHITSTPSYVINGVLVEGSAPKQALEKVMEIIAAGRQKKP